MNSIPKKKNPVLLLILPAFMLAVYCFLDMNYGAIITISYISVFVLGITAFMIYTVKKENNWKNYYIKANEKLRILYNKSNKLLKVFTLYFDNSYRLTHNIITKKENIADTLKDINIAQEFKGMFDDDTIDDTIDDKMDDCSATAINDIRKSADRIKIHQFWNDVDAFYDEIDSFLNIIRSIENPLLADTEERIDILLKKESFQKLAVEYDYYIELMSELILSVTANVYQTSRPLSEEILTIKKSINLFMKIVTTWKENLTSGTSDRNLARLMERYNDQNEGFENAFADINQHYDELKQELNSIINMIDKVFENSGQIQEIADKINLLSINASIESIKAGASGKGFMVIAQEINKLSVNTRLFTKDIVGLIRDTKQVATHILRKFNEGCGIINSNTSVNKSRFGSLYNHLKDYYNDFNVIFTSVITLIDDININITRINPVFQLFDISIQELDNANGMIKKYLSDNREEMNKIISLTGQETRMRILNKLISFIEGNITTDMEIDALDKIARKYGVEKHKKSKQLDIEMF